MAFPGLPWVSWEPALLTDVPGDDFVHVHERPGLRPPEEVGRGPRAGSFLLLAPAPPGSAGSRLGDPGVISQCLSSERAGASIPADPTECCSTSPIHLIHPLETNKQIHLQTNVSAPTAFPDGETLRPHERLHHQVVQVAATQTVPTSLMAHPGFAGMGGLPNVKHPLTTCKEWGILGFLVFRWKIWRPQEAESFGQTTRTARGGPAKLTEVSLTPEHPPAPIFSTNGSESQTIG